MTNTAALDAYLPIERSLAEWARRHDVSALVIWSSGELTLTTEIRPGEQAMADTTSAAARWATNHASEGGS